MNTETAENEIKVWDILVRGFHWSLVILFVVSYLSGEEETVLHPWTGYIITALVMVRIAWGFIGSKYARFSDFIYPRGEIIAYAKGLLSGNAKRYVGHNPLGGVAVIALLVSLTLTTLSGMLAYGDEEGKGPMAPLFAAEQTFTMPSIIGTAYADDDEDEHRGGKHEKDSVFEEVHEFFVNFTLLLVFLHLAGVAVESMFHKENLARAMVTGKKRE